LCSHSAGQTMPLPELISIGEVVRSLSQHNARGAVIMRFNRCAYLQFHEQLVCVGLNELGSSSITCLFDSTLRKLPRCLAVGSSAQFSTQSLLIDNRYCLGLSDAVCYASSLRTKSLRIGPLTTQYELLAKLTKPAAGLAPLLHYYSTAAVHENLTSAIKANNTDSELLRFVMPAIVQLANQIRVNCCSDIAGNTQARFDADLFIKLVGAGPGLTPSGDDFVCGVFAALHLCGLAKVANALWASIRPAANRSTTQVSIALLEQSARGEFGERLENIVRTYFDYSATTAEVFQRQINLIGETSGWDWLAGFVFCGDIVWNFPIRAHEHFYVS